MNDKHRNDILIGKDQWIPFIDISEKRESAINVDYLLLRVEGLWQRLESVCEVGCCGVRALDFYPKSIKRAATSLGHEKLFNELKQIQSELENLPSDVFVSSRLNQYFHKSVLLRLLEHITENIK